MSVYESEVRPSGVGALCDQTGHSPFSLIHIDHVGPFVTTMTQNRYILVIIDTLTKFVNLYAVRDMKLKNVIEALEEFVLNYGALERTIFDRGTCFTSNLYQEFCERYGIKFTFNSPRHPQANRIVERTNFNLIPAMHGGVQ